MSNKRRSRQQNVTAEDAANYRLDHWRERWQCHPWCTAAGPFDRHNARCRSVSPADHPSVGVMLTGWGW